MGKGFIVFLAAAVLVLAAGCNSSGSDDSGGSGADFDSALYYTKTDIDGFLSTVNGKLAKPVMPGDEMIGSTKNITSAANYASSEASWSVTNKVGVLMLIKMVDTTSPGNQFLLKVGTSETNAAEYIQVSCSNTQHFLAYFSLAGSGSYTVKAWCTTIGSSMTLTLIPVVWFSSP